MSTIEFDEDRTYIHSLPPEHTVPDKGFEGWFYKRFPGTFLFKRSILLLTIVLLFIISFIFAGLGRYNTEKDRIRDFQERAVQTKI